jgi:hypothetical protein
MVYRKIGHTINYIIRLYAANGRLYAAVLLNGQPGYIGFTDSLGTSWTAMDLPQTPEADGDIEGLNPAPSPAGRVPSTFRSGSTRRIRTWSM